MDLTPVTDGSRGFYGPCGSRQHADARSAVDRAPSRPGVERDMAGGVIFNGSIDRFFRAYDDQTGKLLWETRLSDVPSNAPISYTVNGKQYIAIGVGNGGAQATGFAPLVSEIQNVDRAPAVWVFQLP